MDNLSNEDSPYIPKNDTEQPFINPTNETQIIEQNKQLPENIICENPICESPVFEENENEPEEEKIFTLHTKFQKTKPENDLYDIKYPVDFLEKVLDLLLTFPIKIVFDRLSGEIPLTTLFKLQAIVTDKKFEFEFQNPKLFEKPLEISKALSPRTRKTVKNKVKELIKLNIALEDIRQVIYCQMLGIFFCCGGEP